MTGETKREREIKKGQDLAASPVSVRQVAVQLRALGGSNREFIELVDRIEGAMVGVAAEIRRRHRQRHRPTHEFLHATRLPTALDPWTSETENLRKGAEELKRFGAEPLAAQKAHEAEAMALDAMHKAREAALASFFVEVVFAMRDLLWSRPGTPSDQRAPLMSKASIDEHRRLNIRTLDQWRLDAERLRKFGQLSR